MSKLSDLKTQLAQLNYAKSKILGVQVFKADGSTPELNTDGSPKFKGGVQSFIIGDTTYYRVRFRDLTTEIERIEKAIEQIQSKMRTPKKHFLDYSYGI